MTTGEAYGGEASGLQRSMGVGSRNGRRRYVSLGSAAAVERYSPAAYHRRVGGRTLRWSQLGGRPGHIPKDSAMAAPTLSSACLISVQVGRPHDYVWLGRSLRSSIDKAAVTGPVAVLSTHLDGDEQADPMQHGGSDKAVYAYASEDLAWWSAELGRDLQPGAFGENLTTQGLDLRAGVIGEQWLVGTALLQVTEPRTPCWKLGMRMGDASFPRAFARARRPGVLLRVLREGHLQVGDRLEVSNAPAHGVTAADVTAMYLGRRFDAARVLAAPELAAHWQSWASHRTVWHLDEERKRKRGEA